MICLHQRHIKDVSKPPCDEKPALQKAASDALIASERSLTSDR
jgi:hypothetical protein